jgi:hypothetical protein
MHDADRLRGQDQAALQQVDRLAMLPGGAVGGRRVRAGSSSSACGRGRRLSRCRSRRVRPARLPHSGGLRSGRSWPGLPAR